MSKQYPRVALYISVYNHEKFIEDALESAISQNYPNLLIYVTDDASTDSSFEIIKNFFLKKKCKHDYKIIRRKKNLGVTKHGLIAVQELSKLVDFIVPQGGDDISLPNRVSVLTEIWTKLGCNKFALIHTPVEIIDNENRSKGIWFPPINQRILDEKSIALNPTSHGLVIGGSAAFTPSLILESPYIFPNIYDDQTITFRAYLKKSLIYWFEPLLKYRFGGGISTSPENKTQYEWRIAISTLDTLKQRKIDAEIFCRNDLSKYIESEIKKWENIAEDAKRKIKLDQYHKWLEMRSLQLVDAEVIAERIFTWEKKPLVAIITFASSKDLDLLADSSDSLRDQLYSNWRWIVVSDIPPPNPLFNSTDFLRWIHVNTFNPENAFQFVVQNLPTDLIGDFFSILPPGFKLSPESLYLICDYFIANKNAAAIYCDHDYVTSGIRKNPKFKPDFDRIFFEEFTYIDQTIWFKTLLISQIRFTPLLSFIQAVLHYNELGEILHIPEVLVSIPYCNKVDNDVCSPKLTKDQLVIEPFVSIVMPIPNLFDLIINTVPKLIHETRYPNYELVLVLHKISDIRIIEFINTITELHKNTKIITDDLEYSLSRLYMVGAQHAKGDILVFLHADVEICQSNWLSQLVSAAIRQNIAAVGPLIVQRNYHLIESAGVWLGSSRLWDVARPAYANQPITEKGFYNELDFLHKVDAITSVCFCTKRTVFESLGGFNFSSFPIADFEIDYCLKAKKSGLDVLVEPLSKIKHYDNAILSELLNTYVAQEKHYEEIERNHQTLLSIHRDNFQFCISSSIHFDFSKTTPDLDLTFPISWQHYQKNRLKILAFSNDDKCHNSRIYLPFKKLVDNGWVQAKILYKVRLPSVTEVMKMQPDTILLHHCLETDLHKRVMAWKRIHSNLKIYISISDISIIFSRQLATVLYEYQQEYIDGIITNHSYISQKLINISKKIPIYTIPDAIDYQKWCFFYEKKIKTQNFLSTYKLKSGCLLINEASIQVILEIVKRTCEFVDWTFLFLDDFKEKITTQYNLENVHYCFLKPCDNNPEELFELDLQLVILPDISPDDLPKFLPLMIEFAAIGTPLLSSDSISQYLENSPIKFLPKEINIWIIEILHYFNDRYSLVEDAEKFNSWVANNFSIDNIIYLWNDILVSGKNFLSA
ncbi:glycosyltransferase [Hydrogenophilus thiooxidans]|uniref:glycosyltransferase n=1 Tax=Hydrogenophilus thiooxidans TaxID=2820326 RepID=UPI001C24777F|nr:glycosyltransferase [Hydrogenophilus thiooxidans]